MGAPIAIIGMSCHFPGAEDYQAFWKNLIQGVNSISEIPQFRWDWREYYGEPEEGKNKTVCKWGGFIEGADQFDAGFFDVSPREAVHIDPQQRISLQLAWQCIEDAGYRPKELAGSDMGVFMAMMTSDYKELMETYSPSLEGHSAAGIHNTNLSNRISYFFDLHGPSLVVDSACAGSLVALHEAIKSIRIGECQSALVGGVNLLATPSTFIRFNKVGMLSPQGSCRTFDQSADGYVRGEGAGMVLLKSLEHATTDGDVVLAVIKGSAINHGGRVRSITFPNDLLQSKVITSAMKDAGVSPSTITYIEAHGTGTPVGDSIEMSGLTRAFNTPDLVDDYSPDNASAHFCGVGTVKTNIGHLEPAAGMAGLIKTVLAMRHKQLPQLLHYSKLNPRINLENTPFYMLDTNRPWETLTDKDGREIPRRAGISCFGFGGVNSHLVLEEAPVSVTPETTEYLDEDEPLLLILSAESQSSLASLAGLYSQLIASHRNQVFSIVVEANQRTLMSMRKAFVASSVDALVQQLAMYSQSAPNVKTASHANNLAFVFSGQGSQYPGMAKHLYETQMVFRQAIDACAVIAEPHMDYSLTELLFKADESVLLQTRYTQPALFAVEYALAQLLLSTGIKPSCVMGHSVGEIVAACIVDILSLEDALYLVLKRGQLMAEYCQAGALLSVAMDEPSITYFLRQSGIDLEIAATNAPLSTVVAGKQAEIDKLKRQLETQGVQCTELNVSHGFHSALMEPMLDVFYDEIKSLMFAKPRVPMISNVTGQRVDNEVCDPNYWVRHVRQPVLFYQGLETLCQCDVDCIIEVGARPVLSSLIKAVVPDTTLVLSVIDAYSDNRTSYYQLLASLHEAGFNLELSNALPYGVRTSLSHPPYPFLGDSYWVDISQGKPPRDAGNAQLHFTSMSSSLLGARVNLVDSDSQYFFSSIELDHLGYLHGHCLQQTPVLPAAAYISVAYSAALDVIDTNEERESFAHIQLLDLSIHQPLVLNRDFALQTRLKQRTNDRARCEYYFEFFAQAVERDNKNDKQSEPWMLTATASLLLTVEEVERQCRDQIQATLSVEIAAIHTVMSLNSRLFSETLEWLDVQQFYEQCDSLSLQYRGSFQGIKRLARSEKSVIAQLQCPVEDFAEGPSNPVLLDIIVQVGLPLLPLDQLQEGQMFLPVGVDKVYLWEPLESDLWVIARLVSDTEKPLDQGIEYSCELSLLNSKGVVIGHIQGLRFKHLSLATVLQSSDVVNDLPIYYRPLWRRCFDQVDLKSKNSLSPSLIVYDVSAEAIVTAIKDEIDAAQRRDISSVITLEVSAMDGMGDLLSQVQQLSIKQFIFIGAFDSELSVSRAFEKASDIDGTPHQLVLSLFRFVQCLQQYDLLDRDTSLTVVSQYAASVFPDDPLCPAAAAVMGFSQTLARELPQLAQLNLDIGVNQLDPAAMVWVAKTIIQELALPSSGFAAYREGERYTRNIHSLSLPATINEHGFRASGVYVIVGGAGGIGISLSRYLAEHYKAKLVWVGRSAMDANKQAAMDSVVELGGEVIYLQADATNELEIISAIEQTQDQFGSINGIIHSALVLNDRSVANMDEQQLLTSLAVKLEGTIALLNGVKQLSALKQQSLDFVLFFSSVNAFLANPGQANYVAACCFQDALALLANQVLAVPVKVINWGVWGEVGAVASEAYQQRLKQQGINSITTKDGLATIERALSLPLSQLIHFTAKSWFLDEVGFDYKQQQKLVSKEQLVSEISYWLKPKPKALDLPCSTDGFVDSFQRMNTLAKNILALTLMEMIGPEVLGSDKWEVELFDNLRKRIGPEYLNHFIDVSESILIGQTIVSPKTLNGHVLAEQKRFLLDNYPWLQADLRLLWTCGEHLAEILEGKLLATDVIFPNLSMELVEAVYRTGSVSQYTNQQLAGAVVDVVELALAQEKQFVNAQGNNAGRKIKVLEVGAGTGGATYKVLQYLKAAIPTLDNVVDYVYTDISPAFLEYGQKQYALDYPSLEFKTFNVEKSPAEQGLGLGEYSVVLASNVLHATKNISTTLQHCKSLLKPGGVLLINELSCQQNFLTLTFGLLEGWWLAEDCEKRIQHSPLLTPKQWRQVFYEEGFSSAAMLPVPAEGEDILFQRVMIGISDGFVLENSPVLQSSTQDRLSDNVSPDFPQVSPTTIIQSLGKTSPEEIQSLLLAFLQTQLVSVLRIDHSRVVDTQPPITEMRLSQFGVDSLTSMELRNRFKQQLDIDIPVEILLGSESIQALLKLLCEKLLLTHLLVTDESADEHTEEETETLVI